MQARKNGFTLAELCASVAIAGVLLAVGIPAWAMLAESAALRGGVGALTHSFALARMTAVSRRHPVTACPSRDGRTCRADLDWSDGWIVYLDRDRADQPASDSEVIWHEAALRHPLRARSTAGRRRVRFQPDGMAGGANLTLTLCSAREHRVVAWVVMNIAGRTYVAQPPRTRPCPYDTAAHPPAT